MLRVSKEILYIVLGYPFGPKFWVWLVGIKSGLASFSATPTNAALGWLDIIHGFRGVQIIF